MPCKLCYGIEKAETPAKYSEVMFVSSHLFLMINPRLLRHQRLLQRSEVIACLDITVLREYMYIFVTVVAIP